MSALPPLPFLYVWRDKGRIENLHPQTWDELKSILQINHVRPQDIENQAFRKQYQITLGFESPAYGAPFYELDIVTLDSGSYAYVKYKGPNDFVLVDMNQQEHSFTDIDRNTSMTSRYANPELFNEKFPFAK